MIREFLDGVLQLQKFRNFYWRSRTLVLTLSKFFIAFNEVKFSVKFIQISDLEFDLGTN